MLVRDIPSSLLWALHKELQQELGPEITAYLHARLEPELLVDLGVGGSSSAGPGSEHMTLILTGTDRGGAIQRSREWIIPLERAVAAMLVLGLKLEDTLHRAREFEAWADRAVEASKAKQPVPPRLLGHRYS